MTSRPAPRKSGRAPKRERIDIELGAVLQPLTIEGLKFPAESRDKAAGYSNLCAGYAMLKQWDKALPHCNTALSIDQNNWRAFNNRAAIYVAKGQYDHAMADLRAAFTNH